MLNQINSVNKTENIDDLIGKFLSGNAQPEEAMLLEDWKNEAPSNQLYFSECEKVYALTKKGTENKKIDSEKAWINITQTINKDVAIKPLQTTKQKYLRIAAAIAFIIGIGAFAGYFFSKNNSQETSYYTTNKTQLIKLNDNTEINILENSKIIVDKNFGKTNRLVHLKGNADFTVTHKDELPFIVDVNSFFIKDIGTKFSVKLSPDTDTVYVNVDEGVVLLFDSLGAELEIKASGKAIYIHSKKQLINVTKSDTSGVSTNLNFDNTKLSQIISELNTIYKTNIVLENAQLNDCTLTTSFENEDINTIITVITETLGLSFEKTQTGYLIKGKKCQQ